MNDEKAGCQQFFDRMLATTVRLVRDAEKFPSNFGGASGFLVPRGEDFILITAGHIFYNLGRWTLETNATISKGTLHLPLRDVQLLVQLDLRRGSVEKIDLAWAKITREDAKAAIADADGPLELEFPVYSGPLDREPERDVPYGFATVTHAVFDKNLEQLERSECYELYLDVAEFEKTTGLVTFGLARPHQGHDYYRGASGSPIADPEGHIVAVLLGGCPKRNVLFGMSLSRYSGVISVTV
jgi:hypothetical protein